MTHIECVVTYDKDMDIANKGSKKKYLTGRSLKFWRRIILVSYEIVMCIFKYVFTQTKIECEFKSIENRGSKMNRSGMSLQCFHVVKM